MEISSKENYGKDLCGRTQNDRINDCRCNCLHTLWVLGLHDTPSGSHAGDLLLQHRPWLLGNICDAIDRSLNPPPRPPEL